MEALRSRVASFHKRTGIEASYKSFGRTEMGIIEVPPLDLRAAALWLRSDEELRFDWLEFMSVYERKNRLHLSYFVRSQARSESCILRISPEIKSLEDWVVVESLSSLWPMIMPYEEEASRFFGIQFLDDSRPSPNAGLPHAFPLRKGHVWEGMPS